MRIRRALVASALVALALPIGASPARADSLPVVFGSGSTWSKIAIDQWRADVARQGLRINYQGNGSSAGRANFISNTNDFAVSEIPFDAAERARMSRAFVYLPIVAGGTSLMYNLRDAAGREVTNLRLSPRTIALIFTGGIHDWSDPAINADNGGRQLPSQPITPVIRSDGSGTSAQFSAFLAKQVPDVWGPFARANGIADGGFTSFWPDFPPYSKGQPGSDQVANYIHQEPIGRGAIGYVEAGYAKARGRPVAAVRNAAGNFTLPTSGNVAIALTKAKINPDRTQFLDEVYVNPDPATYPISSYSYMIAPTTGFDPHKGEAIARFIQYFACAGQQKAAVLGYSPLPPNLVAVAFDAAKNIPGAPPFPRLVRAECNNPTIGVNGGLAPGVPGGGGTGTTQKSTTRTTQRGGANGTTTVATDATAATEAALAADPSGALDPAALDRFANADPKARLKLSPKELAKLGDEKGPSGWPYALTALGVIALVFVPPGLASRRARRQRT